jgi:subtilisin family serine protease
MKVIKIAILDSGVKKGHKEFAGKQINARTLIIQNDEVVEVEDGEDEIGHGTAVHYLIDKLTENKTIYDFKIIHNDNKLSLNDLEKFLSYISNYKIKFDIINISSGIVQCDDTQKLQMICDKLKSSGTVVVAAFDNDGAISFPAALDNVIGVDSSKSIKSINDFIYVENSLINVIGKNYIQKVAWTNPEYNMIAGNSFTCCYVTAKIAKMIQEGNYELKNISTRKIHNKKAKAIDRPFKIEKAAVFPFNKEIHSLARYESMLNFIIEGYYSAKATGLIGKKISTILINCENEKIIKNIEEIRWNEIDTLILGHLDELNLLLRKDYTEILLNKAIENGVRIFSFDALDKYIPYCLR